jgi:hypothetical protein
VIALLCATLLCLSATPEWPVFTFPALGGKAGQTLEGDKEGIGRWVEPLWRFTIYLYGRAVIVDGWESERECRQMKNRMRRDYPDAQVSDCEVSR